MHVVKVQTPEGVWSHLTTWWSAVLEETPNMLFYLTISCVCACVDLVTAMLFGIAVRGCVWGCFMIDLPGLHSLCLVMGLTSWRYIDHMTEEITAIWTTNRSWFTSHELGRLNVPCKNPIPAPDPGGTVGERTEVSVLHQWGWIMMGRDGTVGPSRRKRAVVNDYCPAQRGIRLDQAKLNWAMVKMCH